LTEPELSPPGTAGAALPAPEHPELTPEILEAFSQLDRKCAVFIFPQLRQLGASAAVDELVVAAGELARAAAEGSHLGLADGYRELLGRAQSALREARTAEVAQEGQVRHQRQSEARLGAALLSAKSRLPAARMARLQQRLAELEDSVGADRAATVDAELAEWDRLSQVRQSREAERLADRAHLVVRPRQQETARSRRARRDQARVVELARAFVLGGAEQPPPADPDPTAEG